MKELLEAGIGQIEPDGVIAEFRSVPGGDINEAYYVRTKENEYFVKANRKAEKEFFAFEAYGLKKIRRTNTIRVPHVYAIMEVSGIPMLWLEWIFGAKKNETDRLLGEQLAALHLNEAEGYGMDRDGFIGNLKLPNQMTNDWVAYFRDYRLYPQLVYGKQRGTIAGKRGKQLEAVMKKLERWIPAFPKKSILHGDLWGGNWLAGADGNPYLIDPSIFYGDHEMEIAFTELFGGFSRTFYEAYNTAFPLSESYEERKELYQLYYLLIHLNMFGESYGSAVDRILRKYA
ncbi:MAG TPA: fructosamine kinase family protein [Bacillota bacterium]|jgi:fructosamine-3-kinase|nr:fructosamine kinase family protein [Bacillota bacterium]